MQTRKSYKSSTGISVAPILEVGGDLWVKHIWWRAIQLIDADFAYVPVCQFTGITHYTEFYE